MPESVDRLNGWKEIAAFLNKGIRTVQRWERDDCLPIHRQGQDAKLIFAYRSELEAWVRSGGSRGAGGQEDTDYVSAAHGEEDGEGEAPLGEPFNGTDPRVRVIVSRRPLLIAIVLLFCLAILMGLLVTGGHDAEGPEAQNEGIPTNWKAIGNTLRITDGSGAYLWSHPFGFDISTSLSNGRDDPPGSSRVAIEDFDGDGKREVVFAIPDPKRNGDNELQMFNSDGSLRFRYRPTQTVRFGAVEFAGPWLCYRLFVTTAKTGYPPTLWVVYVHGEWFPSLLVQLSPTGETLSEYWSNGYIEFVTAADWHGSRSLLVGATNNETRGASLAIFSSAAPMGAAPAQNPKYRCQSCPKGAPTEFLVFPRRCISIPINGQAVVLESWRDDLDRLHVMVGEGDTALSSAAWYIIGPDLGVVLAEYSDNAKAFHARMEREGSLDHAFESHGDSSLLPVLRWSGRRFAPVNSQRVAH